MSFRVSALSTGSARLLSIATMNLYMGNVGDAESHCRRRELSDLQQILSNAISTSADSVPCEVKEGGKGSKQVENREFQPCA